MVRHIAFGPDHCVYVGKDRIHACDVLLSCLYARYTEVISPHEFSMMNRRIATSLKSLIKPAIEETR